MFGSLSQRIRHARKRRNKRHLPPPKYFIPRLEELEKREMLAANVVESAADAFMGAAAQSRNDVVSSAITLIHTIQSSANAPASVSVDRQFSKVESVLADDFSQTWQALAHFEFAVLGSYLQTFDTLRADWYTFLTGQPLAPTSAAGSSILVHPQPSGPILGDPTISATEGVQWYGLFPIGDGDGDDSSQQGQYETISGTIDWGDGSSLPFSTGVLEGGSMSLDVNHTWKETGNYTVTVTANDADGGSSQMTETASVGDGQLNWASFGNNAPNVPPSWSQPFEPAPTPAIKTGQTNTEGDTVSVPVQASDSDGDTLSYTALGLPPGLSIDPSSGVISGTVSYGSAEDFGGNYEPAIKVSDGHGGTAETSFSWNINQAQIAPVLTLPSPQTNLRGDSVSVALNTTQVDNDPIGYTAANLPPGLSIDPDTGVISGTVDPSANLSTPYPVTVTATDYTTNLSNSQTFNWTVSPTNVAPVLTIPGNQTNSAGDDVSLQLPANDADGDALTYTATGLPPGLTLDPIGGLISGTLLNSAASSTPYNVTVTSSDGMASQSQNFTWTVNAVSLQNPGDQSNLDGDSVSLQLTAGDANNATLTYSASSLPPGLSINSSTGLISGSLSSTADTGSPYAVTVTATDSNNNHVSQSFNWTINRLAINSVNDQENQEGTAVSLQVSASDNEATPTYSTSGLPPGLSISSSGLITGTIGTGSFGKSPYQVTVTATDGSHTSSQAFVWTVTPRVALVDPGPQSDAIGDSVSLQLSATSPGGTMTYSASGLPPGLSISSTGLISGSPTTAGSTPYNVAVTANDGTSSSSQTFPWTVSTINFVSPGDQNSNDGDTVSLSLRTAYHGSGTLSYSANNTLPSGLSINSSSGQITGTISGTADTNSPYSVTITVTDGTNTASRSFNWTVNPTVTFDPINDQSNAAGDSVSLQVSASDANNSTLTYSATGLPQGLSIGSTTGLISGTVAVGADSGSPYAVTVTATDSAGINASQGFNWTVAHVSLLNPGPQSSIDGAIVSLPLQGKDADGDTVTYTASGLPSGLSINQGTGLISGTVASNADANSPYAVTVTANDSSHTATQTFLWTVSQVALSAPSNQTNTEGDNVSLQLQGKASSGSLTYNASDLPSGLSLNTTTGLISGTIAAGAAANGPYTVDVSATNGTDSTSQTFTWTVNPVVNLTAPADQSNVEGNSVSLQMTATDSKNATLSYTASNLPTGLSISSSGLISGTVSTGDAANGPYLVTVTAADGTYSSTVGFTWTVTHTDTTALTMNNPGTQVNVTGDSANLQINASDPDGKDTLTYSATGLPDGLDIDPNTGIISGTVADDAVSAPPYAVTVTASDGNGQSISQTFSWLINAAAVLDPAFPINAVEGVDTGSITVDTFTTPDLSSQAGDFTATINWGDGTADAGSVSGSNGSFTVTGDHTYAEKGSYAVSITIVNNVTGASTADATTATVADGTLQLTGGFRLGDAMTDPQNSYELAYFTDQNPDAPASDFTVQINWGDGNTSQGNFVQSEGDGIFLIVAQHSYAPLSSANLGPNNYTVSVTVTDVDGASASTTSTVVEGNIASGVAATMGGWSFVDSNPYATTSDFVANGQTGVAVINWGDGASSLGTVTGGPGNGGGPVTFGVAGSHVYTQDSFDQGGGQDTIGVTVYDDDGNTLSGTQYVSVVRPPLTLTTSNVAAPPGSLTLSNVQVATFTVPDSYDGPSEFSSTIYWGDNSSSSGRILEVSPGLFKILGSHSYATNGSYTVLVTVSQGWSQMALAAAGTLLAQVGVPNVMLYSTTFSNGITLANDQTLAAYSAPQWLDQNLNGKIDGGDHQYPYAYVSGGEMRIAAVFKPQGLAAPPNQIQVKSTVFASGPFFFSAQLTPVTLNLNAGQYVFATTNAMKLPAQTEGIWRFRIVWKYSTDGKNWLPAGESTNHIYLTYKEMTAAGNAFVSRKLQTVFSYASSDVVSFNDDSDPKILMNDIWQNFSSLQATRALDRKALSYYKDWTTKNTKYWDLVSKLDGQCASWTNLLIAAMLADGLDSVPNWTIKFDVISPSRFTAYTGFLVKNWSFDNKGFNINYLSATEIHSYKWTPGEPVQAHDEVGIKGQNEDDPASLFDNHQVVELDIGNNDVILYDPSYGKKYEAGDLNDALQQFQAVAIAGLYQEEPATIDKVGKVRKLSIVPNKVGDNSKLRIDITKTF